MSVLILGAATDGPANEVTKLASLTEIKDTYGFKYKQYLSVAPTATSIVLNYEPLDTVYNKVEDNYNWLYSPVVSGTTLYCGVVGGSGNQAITLEYTPYLGKSDLLLAALRYFERNGTTPYLGRIGGVCASFAASGWTFKAVYPGFKYNQLFLSSVGTSITISTYDPTDTNLSYTGTPQEIVTQIISDAIIGLSPVTITEYTSSLASFSAYLTGGTDGGITTAGLTEFFESASIPSDIHHIIVLATASTGIVETLNILSADIEVQPRIYYLNAPTFYYPIEVYASALATSFTARNDRTCMVLGELPYAYRNKLFDRFAAEAVGIALHSPKFSLTNMKLDGSTFTPVLSGSELETIINSGIMPLTRFIRNDVAVYRANMFNTNQTYNIAIVQAQIAGACNKVLEPLLGTSFHETLLPVLESELRKKLISSVPLATIETVKIHVFDLSTIVVNIVARVDDEVLEIKFKVGGS